jgi:hypothetical protein
VATVVPLLIRRPPQRLPGVAWWTSIHVRMRAIKSTAFFGFCYAALQATKRRRLTCHCTDSTLSLPGNVHVVISALPGKTPGSGIDEIGSHTRELYVLLPLQRSAGVCRGLDSESSSESRRPTRQTARWVFCFLEFRRAICRKKRAPVAKWLTRGSAKPVFAGSIPARCSKKLTTNN